MFDEKRIAHCYECKYCFESKRSKTGYSCSMWGYDDFASDTRLDGFCHKAKTEPSLESLAGLRMYETAEDAEKILRHLRKIAGEYGIATRGDYLKLIGVESYTDDYRHGWLESALVKCARVVPTPLGYFIELPVAFPID